MKSDLFQICHIFRFYSKEQHVTFFLGKFELFKTVGQTFANYIEGADSGYSLQFFCKIVKTVDCFDGKILIKTKKKIFDFFQNISI